MRASSACLLLASCGLLLASTPAAASLTVGEVPGAVSREWLATNAADVDKQVTAALRASAFEGLVAPDAITARLGAWVDTGAHAFPSWPSAIAAAVAEIDPTLARWRALSSGEHSFRALDRSMYVECQMQPVPEADAELIFFNHALAAELGLHVPLDETKLSQLVIRSFAWRTAACGDAIGHAPAPPSLEPMLAAATPELGAIAGVPRTMIATRYQDSGGKDPLKDALGDGRAVWTGEVGGPRYADVLIKGVGKTSLEWRGHSSPAHSDGLQSLGEGVHSYLISMINEANGVASTRDLALIKLKHVIKNDEERNTNDPATITVRVGQQLRMGHLEYWADDPARFAEIVTYAIRRSLGIQRQPTAEDVEDYLREYAANSGRDDALLYYLHSFHGSVTRGNRTTEGAFIDNGTWNYLDAHHSELKTGPIMYGSQVSEIKAYVDTLIGHMKKAGYLEALRLDARKLKSDNRGVFDGVFRERLRVLMLRRLGYADEDILAIIERLDQDQQLGLLDAYVAAAQKVYEAMAVHGGEHAVMGKSITPARFNARRMLRGIASVVGRLDAQPVAWAEPVAPEQQAAVIERFEKATFPRSSWEPDLAALCQPAKLDWQCAKLITLASTTFALTDYAHRNGYVMRPELIEQRSRPRPADRKAREVLWEAFDQTIRHLPSLADRNAAIRRAGAPYLD